MENYQRRLTKEGQIIFCEELHQDHDWRMSYCDPAVQRCTRCGRFRDKPNLIYKMELVNEQCTS